MKTERAAQEPGRGPGTYVLVLSLDAGVVVATGALGRLAFDPGFYAYVGSAFGPGGVAARCDHHLRVSLRPHWHIDYLRAHVLPRQIWFCHDPEPREHQWAGLLRASRGSRCPHPGFGASDCRCRAHLFHFEHEPSFEGFRRRARGGVPGQGPIGRRVLDTTGVWGD